MKRELVAILLAILICSLATCSLICTKHAVYKMSNELEQIKLLAIENKYEQAHEKTLKMCEKWKKYNNLLSMYVSHSELNIITNSIARIMPLDDKESRYELLSEISAIEAQLQLILQKEKPAFQNLL